MNWAAMIGRLLGYDEVSRIDAARVSFGSAWAHSSPALLLFGCVGLAVLSYWFYLRWQARGHKPTRLTLATLRALALCLLFVILADPILELTFVSNTKPVLWLMFDGSDSMSIPDELPSEERDSLAKAVEFSNYNTAASQKEGERPPRADFAKALLSKSNNNLVDRLSKNFRLRAFSFADEEGVHPLALEESQDPATSGQTGLGKAIAAQWKTVGNVSAIGDAFEDLASKYATDNLAGIVVVSDFDQNSGTAPLAAARKLGVPVFTVGVGPLSAVDLTVDLLAPPTMKKAESSSISVTIRQRELDNASARVTLYAQPFGDTGGSAGRITIGERTITLSGGSTSVEFPYTPDQAGRYVFTAEVDPVEGESISENNRAEREVRIIDDFLRLMFVEYEPTWEWRFVKEVFHRDKLVGLRGFRTFIRSADPVVRETNELFLPSLTPPRSQFFENDVIFLGDMPASTLSTRFCEMTKEFVSQFGGGLVVMAGSRFGPGELAETPLADMLPVVVDPDAKRKDETEFRLALTPVAGQYDFMRLGQADADNAKGWMNLGKLPWYQPVRRVESKGTQVLAEHPTDTCVDGKTKQPLIAIRQYGRGEVVYIAHNEMWRLRRLHGEEYYRQFWGQLIHRLGLSHALGSHKRFVVRTDKQQYRPDEQMLVTVEAYDKEFHPLDEKDIPDRRLTAELVLPERDADTNRTQMISLTQLKPGVFEARVPVVGRGEHRLRVADPIAQEISEVSFQVANVSVERRNPIRNIALQSNIAAETQGKSYDLLTADKLPDEFVRPRIRETSIEVFPLWSTWLTFATVIGLLLVEWFVRKLVNLA